MWVVDVAGLEHKLRPRTEEQHSQGKGWLILEITTMSEGVICMLRSLTRSCLLYLPVQTAESGPKAMSAAGEVTYLGGNSVWMWLIILQLGVNMWVKRRAAIPPPIWRSAHALTTHLLIFTTFCGTHQKDPHHPTQAQICKWTVSPPVGLGKRQPPFLHFAENIGICFQMFTNTEAWIKCLRLCLHKCFGSKL